MLNDTLQSQRQMRRVVPAVVIVLGLLLLCAVVIQQAAAQDNGTLKPPFKLVYDGAAPPDQHGPVALPLGAPIIMSQIFNSTYNPSSDINTLGWHEATASGAVSQYTWGRVTTGPHPDTVWNMGHNPAGSPQLTPGTDNYTKSMQALLIYGPLNLTDYTQLVMTGTYWLDTAPGDYMGVAYSTDGTIFKEVWGQTSSNPSLSQSSTFYASLDEAARKPVVWIALAFDSSTLR